MRFVALALILSCLPFLTGWLRQREQNRDRALALLGVSFFLSGVIKFEASAIAWPLWGGVARGTTISVFDMVTVALIMTRRRYSASFPNIFPLALYIAAALFSILFSTVKTASFFYVFQLLRCLAIYFAVASELHRPRALKALLSGLAIGLAVQAGYVAYQKLTGVVQAHGTFAHQNTLGMMAELSLIPIVAALFGGESSKWLKVGAVCGLIIVTGGGSRGTIALVGVGLFFFTILSLIQGYTPAKGKIIGLGAGALLLIAPIGVLTLKSRFGSTSMLAEEDQRTAMERAANAISTDHPFGVGANLYVAVANLQGYSERAGVSWAANNRGVPVHNAFLLTLAEMGWPGLVSFIILFLVPAVSGIRYAFRFRRTIDGSVALGSSIAILTVMYHSRLEFVINTYDCQGLLWLNIAVISGLIRMRQVSRQRHIRPSVVRQRFDRANLGNGSKGVLQAGHR